MPSKHTKQPLKSLSDLPDNLTHDECLSADPRTILRFKIDELLLEMETYGLARPEFVQALIFHAGRINGIDSAPGEITAELRNARYPREESLANRVPSWLKSENNAAKHTTDGKSVSETKGSTTEVD